ncbi:MAG TPA: beta-N-acetylhexosaminidase [Longimicrobiaceae bacterium]|nr:beta-N-acetylhexosaminidase [Longimicrobiaceae bacterium]
MRPLASLLCGVLLFTGCSDLLSPSDRGLSDAQLRRYPVVPIPAHLRPRSGELRLTPQTRIVLSDPGSAELRSIAALLVEPLRAASGLPFPVSPVPAAVAETDAIVLRLAAGLAGTSPERYRLSVTRSRAELTAATPAGLFRGTQTLRQLLPAAVEEGVRARSVWGGGGTGVAGAPGEWTVPAVEIEDAPRFPYRGMHLDVSRHFMPAEFVKKYIDLLALYKFNHFHWHLTDDQGWRIEIRKYPRLTQVGAWRRETVLGGNLSPYVGDGTPHGGFYTQDQIRDIVAYAAARHVTIVPEIEMPGHSRAAIAAYPELSCHGQPVEVATTWGIFLDVYCPKEETFAFLEDVLTEVMALFPGEYIHVGGDEVRKEQWANSPIARELIDREGLAWVDGLQSYFIRRIGTFLNSRGRKLIGWDEIMQGGIPPGATVMSWRGADPGYEAARRGHDVIMAPLTHTYFDHYQADPGGEPLAAGGLLTLEKVYDFDPAPPRLGAAEAGRILGAQGNVWTEYMPTPRQVEYMVFPRLLALSEAVWSPREARGWKGFQARLPAHTGRLDRLGVRYRVP